MQDLYNQPWGFRVLGFVASGQGGGRPFVCAFSTGIPREQSQQPHRSCFYALNWRLWVVSRARLVAGARNELIAEPLLQHRSLKAQAPVSSLNLRLVWADSQTGNRPYVWNRFRSEPCRAPEIDGIFEPQVIKPEPN